jgi:hypothetical protein
MKKTSSYHQKRNVARHQRKQAARAQARRRAAAGRQTATKAERRARAYSKPVWSAPVFQSRRGNWARELLEVIDLRNRTSKLQTDLLDESEKAA